ncbi:F0F1 ATP synthase subunit delta [Homoserinibacter sp. YIM 151385]|uniref:F0F1 ATP synthase subunit delta n=1 Tax=Homoserinibacter sp. YIM 151385 TaxID=2985506 RepID=UPI0022F1219F|nr:F0F1 ATP synthase subunit delta [Homoserinibacter sp. YIM 151385]WBU38289.1 F0F1 ATP synthase subunit delta [Homoserinibacter sp. YIM 151385]
MGSATRQALQAAKSALASTRGVKLETGEQLLAAGRAVDGSAQLRALLADPAVPESDKTAIIGRVFGSFDAPATKLLGTLAGVRWSSAAELVDGIEEIGIRAVAMASRDDIVGELFAFGAAVASDAELELAVGAKLSDPAGKVALVERLLGGRASASTTAIVRHLVQSPRGRRIGALVAQAARIVADSGDAIVATVTAASAPSAAQLKKLTAALAAQYGRTPRINLVIDPAILGGLRVQVGDDVIDGSVSARLQDLRIQLAG